MVTTYGMTETAGGCVYDGVPLDGVRVRVDRRRRASWPARCWRWATGCDPAATAEAFADGWFRTRDAGSLDRTAGSPCTGRLDDVVITGGVNVAPAAVEAVLREHPDVADAVVFGRPDDEWGQRVVAAVVPAPGARPELAELRAWVDRPARRARRPARAAPDRRGADPAHRQARPPRGRRAVDRGAAD